MFISYSSRNKEIAKAVKEGLESSTLRTWYAPVEIIAGKWPTRIVEGIRDCDLLLLILSEDSNRSEHVFREVALADHYKKRLHCFEIEPVKLLADA